MSSGGDSKPKTSLFARKKLTPFLAHEMIYDYAAGLLDGERKSALEEFLKTDTESQILLKNIESAQAYATKLKGLEVEKEALYHLLEAETAISLGRRYSSWRAWPETLRWSLTAIALSAVVAGGIALVPWAKLSPRKTVASDNVEVAVIPGGPHGENEAPANQIANNEEDGSGDEPPGDGSGDEGSGDDVADSGDGSGDDEESAAPAVDAKVAGLSAPAAHATPTLNAPAPVATPAVPPVALNKSAPGSFFSYFFPSLPKSTPAPKPVDLNQPTNVAANTPQASSENLAQTAAVAMAKKQPQIPPPANAADDTSESRESHEQRDPKAKGFVYRAFMTLNDLDEIAPKITADIAALGGEKAGEVELGWKRGSGRYYHFMLPETNEKKILERLQVYGPVRISKDPHPRVMPPGEVRFILWVESASQ